MENSRKSIFSKTIAIVLSACLLLSIISGIYTYAFAESAHRIESTGDGISDVSGGFDVKLTEYGDNTIRFDYYFTTHNNWLVHDTIDCKLDVWGNSTECEYDLIFSYYNSDYRNSVPVLQKQETGKGNNNYWTMWAPTDDTMYATIKGVVSLGVEKIEVNLVLKF